MKGCTFTIAKYSVTNEQIADLLAYLASDSASALNGASMKIFDRSENGSGPVFIKEGFTVVGDGYHLKM